MDLDIGNNDPSSHTHVPAMRVQFSHNRMIALLARDMSPTSPQILEESEKALDKATVARVQGQPDAEEEDSQTSDENVPRLVPKSAQLSGRRHHHQRMLVDNLICRYGMSQESLLERRAVGTLANDQTALGTFLKFVEDVDIDGALVAYSNDCIAQRVQHHHGSQLRAAVMDRWPSCSRFGSRKLRRPAPVWEGIAAQLTLLNHQHMGAFILILLATYMRPSEILAWRKKDLAPPRVPLLPRRSIAMAASETGVSTMTGISSWISADFNRSTSSSPGSRQEIRRRKSGMSITLQRRECSRLEPTLLGLGGMTMYHTRHSGASIDRVRGF